MFTSDEKIRIIKERYLKSIKKIPEYNVISFHIKGTEYNLGSFKTTPTQEEPGAKLFTYALHPTISDYICSFGEEENNFGLWNK